MWPFSKGATVNKTVVSLTPPIVGTFQEHIKVLKQFLPQLTKEEIEIARDLWTTSSYGKQLRFLSPLDGDKANALELKLEALSPAWHVTTRSLDDPSCDCSNYYASPCCNGLTLGITMDCHMVYDFKLPESLLTRGSFMEELSNNKTIEMTPEELRYCSKQGARLGRDQARRLVEEA